MQIDLNFVPASAAPEQWKDGRKLFAKTKRCGIFEWAVVWWGMTDNKGGSGWVCLDLFLHWDCGQVSPYQLAEIPDELWEVLTDAD